MQIKSGGKNLTIDLCQVHTDEMLLGARTSRPGRRRGEYVTAADFAGAKRRGRPRGSKNSAKTAATSEDGTKTAPKNGRRRGRPPKTDSAPKATASAGASSDS